jgi:hypothetical protein
MAFEAILAKAEALHNVSNRLGARGTRSAYEALMTIFRKYS